MKKCFLIYVITIVFVIIFSNSVLVFAADEAKTNNVEISFREGDKILKINGKDVEVEKPFVVNGTTLVPIRVITEAFGAKVDWNESDKTITLKYSETVIKLQVDNKDAFVDNQSTQLLEPPVVVNDKTMVPLRFITENFGADVKYDDQTQYITVVKQITEGNSIKDFSLILKKTTKSRIGDSFQDWSISLPKKTKMTYRNFNGDYNDFEADDETYTLELSMWESKDETLDSALQELTNIAQDYTLIDQGKKEINGQKYAMVVYKGTFGVAEIRVYIKDKKVYQLYLEADDYDKYKGNKEITSMLDSFKVGFINDGNTEDLSDATKDGYRVYEDKKLNWSANILADWVEQKDQHKSNEATFVKPIDYDDSKNFGAVHISMYSVEDGLTLDKWIESENQKSKEEYNTNLLKLQPAEDVMINGVKAKKVLSTIKVGNSYEYGADIYLIGENYKYQLSYYTSEKNYNEMKSQLENMLNSFKFDEPDYDEVGKMIDPYMIERNESMKIISNKEYKWSCQIPTTWTESDKSNGKDTVIYSDSLRPKGVTILSLKNEDASLEEFVSVLEDGFDKSNKTGTMKIDKKEYITQKGQRIYKVISSNTADDIKLISVEYVLIKNGYIYIVSFGCSDLYNSEKTQKMFEDIWNSMTFE